jgi:hypothetical protein
LHGFSIIKWGLYSKEMDEAKKFAFI